MGVQRWQLTGGKPQRMYMAKANNLAPAYGIAFTRKAMKENLEKQFKDNNYECTSGLRIVAVLVQEEKP